MLRSTSIRLIASALLLLPLILALTPHKFYVSLSQIDVNQEDNVLEISCRAFSHDIEEAIAKSQGIKLLLGTEKQHTSSQLCLKKYVEEAIKIKVKGESLDISLIGFELEEDIIWLYAQTTKYSDFEDIQVHNSLLMDLFPDQKNIINFNYGKLTRSVICTKNKPTHDIRFTL